MSAVVRALARAARLLSRERRQWVEALLAECDHVEPGRERRRWIAGGAWLLVRQLAAEPLHRPTWTLRAAVAASVALVGLNILRYPQLVSQSPGPAAALLTLFVMLLTAFLRRIRAIARRGDGDLARGTVGRGLVAGALLLAALAEANLDPSRQRWPVAVELGLSGCAALAFAMAGIRRARAGLRAAIRGGLDAGMTAGLTVFVGGVGLAMAFVSPADGAPANTAPAVRHDLPALALAAAGDTLSGAIMLLAWIPLVAGALGLLAGLVRRP
jgi:hypothetical protein